MKAKPVALALLAALLAAPLVAQDAPPSGAPAPTNILGDAGKFIRQNQLHQISGFTTLALATSTGALGLATANGWLPLETGREIHGALAKSTVVAGAVTLGLGATAFSNRLGDIWPHVALVGLAEAGWIVNAFVLEPGSLPHQINGAVSVASLYAGILAIILLIQ